MRCASLTVTRGAQVALLFHEFGHALHALFSRTRFAAPRAVGNLHAFPAQLHEMLSVEPDVLRRLDAGLGDDQIARIRYEFAAHSALNHYVDLLGAVTALHWHRQTDAAASGGGGGGGDPIEFVHDLLVRYRVPFLVFPGDALFSTDALDLVASVRARRLAQSACNWIRAQGGLGRRVGDRLRYDVLEKGSALPFDQVAAVFGTDLDAVTLFPDLDGVAPAPRL